MKTRTTMKNAMFMLLTAAIGFSSCKKSDDPKPNPSANTDNVNMGTAGVTTINVLANDSYTGNATLTITNNFNYGTLVVNTDKTITFTSRTNFYGTATLNYQLQDDNGYSTGNIVIKRGTDAQIETYQTITSFVPNSSVISYAINGDTSGIYTPQYTFYGINYVGFNNDKLQVFMKNDIIPQLGNNTYSILSDGSISSVANNGSTVILQFVGPFTASAKKRDGSGQYMTVSGYTLKYGTDVFDFTIRID